MSGKIILCVLVLLISGCTQQQDQPSTSAHPEDIEEPELTLEMIESEIDAAIERGNLLGDEHYQRLYQALIEHEEQGRDVSVLMEKLSSVYPKSISPVEEDEKDTEYQDEQKKEAEGEGVSVRGKGNAELVGVGDGVAAWLAKDTVLQVIDVSDPGDPSHTGTIETLGFAGTAYQDDEYIYAAGSEGLMIIPREDPFGEPVGTFVPRGQGFWATAMTVQGGYAYLQGEDLLILDVSDPANPLQVSRTEVQGEAPSKIMIKDDHAFIVMTLGGLVVMDISDLENPRQVDIYPFESHTTGFDIRGSYAYLAYVASLESSESDYEFSSVMEVIDISDPASLEVVGSVSVPTNFKGLDLYGNHAYITGSYPHRLTVVDITDPKDPKKMTGQEIRTEGASKGLSIMDGYAYLMDSGSGLRVLDVRDPENPVQVAYLELLQMLSGMHASHDRVFLVADQHYLNVADVSDPENPVGTYSGAIPSSSYPYTSIVIDDKKAYSNAHYSAFYDLEDPYNPRQFDMDVSVDSIVVRDGLLYTVIGEIGLSIYDISDAGGELVSVTNFAQGMCRDFSLDGDWAVCVANKPYSINVMDVSDPENPVAKGTHVFDEYAMSVTVKDGHVYAAQGEDGLDIFRIGPDGGLEFLTNYPTNAYRVTVEGKTAYILSGIEVLDVSDPGNPVRVGQIDPHGSANQAKIYNGYMYVASGDAGLTVIPVWKEEGDTR